MKDNYLIQICGQHSYGPFLSENTDTTVVGSFGRRDGGYQLSFSEMNEEGDENVETVIKIRDDDKVTITRNAYSKLMLEKGQRHTCQYETPMGDLRMGVFAERVDCSLSKHGGTVDVKYSIDFDSNLQSINEVKIKVWEAKS